MGKVQAKTAKETPNVEPEKKRRGRPPGSKNKNVSDPNEPEKAAWKVKTAVLFKILRPDLEINSLTRTHNGKFSVSIVEDTDENRFLVIEDDETVVFFTNGEAVARNNASVMRKGIELGLLDAE